MDSIVIRIAANGFIINRNDSDGSDSYTEEFIANDIDEVTYFVREMLINDLHSIDMSNIMTDTMTDA